MSNNVQAWFGTHFSELHPLLQELHTKGGTLYGLVEISFAYGLAGVIGRALAKKLSISPVLPFQDFSVTISAQEDGLHWERCFEHKHLISSTFIPYGTKEQGHWVETTGAFKLFLTVDIKDGGWYWRPLKLQYKNIVLPGWLFPDVTAFKRIEADSYYFFVGFSFPFLGQFFSYSGLLNAQIVKEVL